jgi:hypothetical protein
VASGHAKQICEPGIKINNFKSNTPRSKKSYKLQGHAIQRTIEENKSAITGNTEEPKYRNTEKPKYRKTEKNRNTKKRNLPKMNCIWATICKLNYNPKNVL